MRIGIVNDLSVAVEILKKIVISAGYKVAWIARNGEQGVDKCCADVPDLVLMDLVMPVMDGVEATRRIMRKCPCSILLVTASVESNYSMVFEAMGAGALDVAATPEIGSDGDFEGAGSLLGKISVIRKLQGNGREVREKTKQPESRRRVPPLLAIGSSTGGPSALARLMSALPEDFPAAIAIVQHVDGQFSENLAHWLDGQTKMKVRLARNGQLIEAGKALVAPGDRHMLMTSQARVRITSGPEKSLYVPSVDMFFDSLCESGLSIRSVAVLLTGMGNDGARGMLKLKEKGWLTIAQDKESSVVWGMPGAAVKLGATGKVCSIDNMATVLAAHFKK